MAFFKKISKTFIILKHVYIFEGNIMKFVLKFLTRLFQYVFYKIFKNSEFELNNQRYKYFYSLFNITFTNERSVEVPIIMDVVYNFSGKEVLEVGNVLNLYYKFEHDVVDKYEKNKGIINQDIVDYKPGKKYDLIISISTLEHIGWDETPKENYKILKAIDNMANLLSENGLILVTFSLGYNENIDILLEENKLRFTDIYYLKRISKDNRWKQVQFNEVKDIKYNFPYPGGNAIAIGTIKK